VPCEVVIAFAALNVAPAELVNVVNAPVDAVVAPMAVEFRPVEVNTAASASEPLTKLRITNEVLFPSTARVPILPMDVPLMFVKLRNPSCPAVPA